VSNVVDASNYVMLELGKPTHTFNGAAVQGRTIVVRLAQPGERLETLDHVERQLTPDTLIIADTSGPIGIAGVMGGAHSEITDDTTEIAIESAVFDAVSVRRTGHRYALRSEASLRFEKGQETRLARIGADRVAQLTQAWSGGTIAVGRIDTAPVEPEPTRLTFRPVRVGMLLGAPIATSEQRELLSRVGIETESAPAGSRIQVAVEPRPLVVDAGTDEVLTAIVPTWRRDLSIEADITEEVARIRGYETTPAHLPDTLMPAYRHPPTKARNAMRETLAGAGLTEVVTHALIDPADEAKLEWPDDDGLSMAEPVAGRTINVTNPLSAQHSILRRHLAASLVDVLALNERQGRESVAIFEIGKGYGRSGDLATEWNRLGILLAGDATPHSWTQPARPFDIYDAKGVVELLCRRLGLPEPSYSPDDRGYPFHPGRALTAQARSDKESLGGRIAELHPDVLEKWDLRVQRVIVAELSISGLASGDLDRVRVEPMARFPEVDRDLAIIVDEARPAAEVAESIGRHGGSLLRRVALFDLYRGAPLAASEKSLAYRLVFGADDRTLTESEIDGAMAQVRAGVEADIGARIRS